ncbi:MBL fold metallo-hydrolase [Marispirochaeta sp.]|uniref:MBL fold metallo-hydrolase n=1 Tax=Marispirochaeta sp. TaxID=2038653 RepID=UPI0029C8A06A|nr:MBL fold metallo-hydrolase [Marispirochaeta sp.]
MPPVLPSIEIHSVAGGHAHVYLVKAGDTGVLVDAGIPGSEEKILAATRRAGLEPEKISLILLTHAHYDHAGSLAELKEATGAPVCCSHYEETHLLSGRTPFPKGLGPYTKTVSKLAGKILAGREQFNPVQPDILITGERDLSEFGIPGRIVPMPGHSGGSIALLLENEAAFIGDAAFNILPWSVVPPFADDPKNLVTSWRYLLQSGAERFYPGHGKPFSRDKLAASLERLIKKAQRESGEKID